MKLSELIKNATDILASHGDMFVDFEIGMETRYKAKGLEMQKRCSRSNEVITVIYGSEKDDYE